MTGSAILKHNKDDLALIAIANSCIASGLKIKLIPHAGTSVLTLLPSKDVFEGQNLIVRCLGRQGSLYGNSDISATQIDFFLGMVPELGDKATLPEYCARLNAHLTTRSYLVGQSPSIADFLLVETMSRNVRWNSIVKTGSATYAHMFRWFSHVQAVPAYAQPLAAHTAQAKKAKSDASKSGSYRIDLPGAEEGKVVTRFPPEPSGYLHVGHIKALLLNDYFAQEYKGSMILRFDDTNPSKEKQEYVDNIIKDLNTLGVVYSRITYTSDYFDLIMDLGNKMIKMGKAYCDDTPVEQMRAERMDGIESKHRTNTVEQNMSMFAEMQKGSEYGLKFCVRAKISMTDLNKCLRDPVMFRCNVTTPHHRTGTKYKVYPTYDFCCPIVDSIEDVTHTLRTVEYNDRDAQFYWFLDQLELRKPHIWAYSRMNFVYTLLSKRKLQWFVDQGFVEGWMDPRFPTMQGILRRGLTVQALREFIKMQGASRTNNLMEWDKLWTLNKQIIDPIIPRFNCCTNNQCVLTLSGVTPSSKEVSLHPKNPSVGTKFVDYTSKIIIEHEDAKRITEGEEVTLMSWGNAIIDKITTDSNGAITGLTGKLHLEGNVKKTKVKLNWLAYDQPNKLHEVKLIEFSHLITVKCLEEGMELKDYVTQPSKAESIVLGEPAMSAIKHGDYLQIQRRGYYICDKAATADSPV